MSRWRDEQGRFVGRREVRRMYRLWLKGKAERCVFERMVTDGD
jgi:hypothetical protein